MTARASTSRKLVHYFLEKLSGILAQAYGVGAKNLGDQGGYAQLLDIPKQAITIIEKAIQAAGYEPGTETRLDAAASEFYNAETQQ